MQRSVSQVARGSVAWRIFLGAAVVVVAVAAVALVMTARAADRAADVAIARGLSATRLHVRSLLERRELALEASGQMFARNAAVRAILEHPPADHSAFFKQAGEAVERLGASTVHIIDARGVRLAQSDDSAARPDTLARSALVGRALTNRRASGAAVTADTGLQLAVAVPVEGASNRVVGVLMATTVINDSTARAIAAAMSSAIVFFALDSVGRPRIAGSSLPRDDALSAFLAERAPLWAAADPGPTASTRPAAPDSAEELLRTDVTLGGTRWVASGSALRSAGGAAVGGFVALRSLDAEIAPFTELERFIVFATLGGLLLALGLSYVMARPVSRRVDALEAAVRRAAVGDYSADVAVHGRDDIGRLAESVRTMLADLREKRDLVEFLGADTGVHPHGERPASNGLEPGHKLASRYEIIERIGCGGTGTVYRARDLELSELVAVKMLRRELVADTAALARFKSDLRHVRRLSHRGVVRTYDLGETDGTYFVTMEYVHGTSLEKLIAQRGRLPVHVTLLIARQLCRALEVAHAEGIVHRDVKPHNMVLTPDGVLKVMDFGIARLHGRTPGLTQSGVVVGTPEYMAPEQLLGEDIDARADVYAVGVVIYECLTGRTPHTADNPTQLMSNVMNVSPALPHELVPDVPTWLSEAVMAALHRDRSRRTKTIAEVNALLAGTD
jgi:serine/threonine-protein kinase